VNFIIENQALILPLLGSVIVWILGVLLKKQIDKTQIVQILTIILDIVQNISNEPASADLANYAKKELAVARVDAALDLKKKARLGRIFGSIGAAVEFVYKNRKWLFSAAGKLIKGVL
jgi:hypothetical protein